MICRRSYLTYSPTIHLPVSTIGTGAWYGGASAYVMYDYMPDQSATEEIPIHEGEVVKVLEPGKLLKIGSRPYRS